MDPSKASDRRRRRGPGRGGTGLVSARPFALTRESFKTLGMRDRQALIVQHTDRAHRHCHIVVNRVSPEDGRAASRTHDARALSAWARTWERERGGCALSRATVAAA